MVFPVYIGETNEYCTLIAHGLDNVEVIINMEYMVVSGWKWQSHEDWDVILSLKWYCVAVFFAGVCVLVYVRTHRIPSYVIQTLYWC